MFGFSKSKADVIDHWYALVPGFNSSTKEFYEAVEKELKEREVPGLEIFHVDFAEGGIAVKQAGIFAHDPRAAGVRHLRRAIRQGVFFQLPLRRNSRRCQISGNSWRWCSVYAARAFWD